MITSHPSYRRSVRTNLTDAIGTILEWIAAADTIRAEEEAIDRAIKNQGYTGAEAAEERKICVAEDRDIARARDEQAACVRGLAGYDTDTLSDAYEATRAPHVLRDSVARCVADAI